MVRVPYLESLGSIDGTKGSKDPTDSKNFDHRHGSTPTQQAQSQIRSLLDLFNFGLTCGPCTVIYI